MWHSNKHIGSALSAALSLVFVLELTLSVLSSALFQTSLHIPPAEKTPERPAR